MHDELLMNWGQTGSSADAISDRLKERVYARHGREPFGPERLDLSSSTSPKAEGLMGCPFDTTNIKRGPPSPALREGRHTPVPPFNLAIVKDVGGTLGDGRLGGGVKISTLSN